MIELFRLVRSLALLVLLPAFCLIGLTCWEPSDSQQRRSIINGSSTRPVPPQTASPTHAPAARAILPAVIWAATATHTPTAVTTIQTPTLVSSPSRTPTTTAPRPTAIQTPTPVPAVTQTRTPIPATLTPTFISTPTPTWTPTAIPSTQTPTLMATPTQTPAPVPTDTPTPSTPEDSATTTSSLWEQVPNYEDFLDYTYETSMPCKTDSLAYFDGGLGEHFLDWSPDGSKLIFGHGTTIQTIDKDGLQPQLLVDMNPWNPPLFHFHADVSPADSRIVYSTCRFATDPPSWWSPFSRDPDSLLYRYYDLATRHYEIATANIEGAETRRLTENIHLDHFPVWSPDGTRIAFVSDPKDWYERNIQLYTMASDGSDVRLLATTLERVALYPPVWSPDGKRIAFVGLESRFQRVVYIIGADGSDLTRISGTDSVPSWSPDGLELAFAMGGEDGGIYTVHPDGTGLRLITPARASVVSWSPDGRELLFIADRTAHVIGVDGSGLRAIDLATVPWVKSPTVVNAAWSPNGSRIAMLIFDGDLPDLRLGYYNSVGRVVTVAADGTDLRTLVRWEPSDWNGAYKLGPGRLIAGNPDAADDPRDDAPCDSEVVIPDPNSNPRLVKDCEALIAFRDTRTTHHFLDWLAYRPLAEWEGVTVSGAPPRVRELILEGYVLPGPIPPELGDLTALEHLNLRWNRLEGGIPLELLKLTELRVLRLSVYGESVQGILRELSTLTKLEVLNLRAGIKEAIPPELGQLANLKTLNLWGSMLTGAIPPELGQLADLRILDLGINMLTGAVPHELGRLTNLESMTLWGNQLTGSIPRELGQLSDLHTLYLSENQLTGVIPPEMSGMKRLKYLDLYLNDFSGCVPAELSDLWVRESGLVRCSY